MEAEVEVHYLLLGVLVVLAEVEMEEHIQEEQLLELQTEAVEEVQMQVLLIRMMACQAEQA
jgi:hypothetical protein